MDVLKKVAPALARGLSSRWTILPAVDPTSGWTRSTRCLTACSSGRSSGRDDRPLSPGVGFLNMDMEAVKSRLQTLDLRGHFHYPDHQYPGLRRSAVLVPLVSRQGELHVLLAQRAHGMRVQGGHVGFPGGVKDTDDQHELETALREAEEEIGLASGQVEVLAMMPPYFIEPNFTVVPFLGLVSPLFQPRPNPDEVALVFELPLRDFLSSDVTRRVFDHGGFRCTYPVLRHRLAEGVTRGAEGGSNGGRGMSLEGTPGELVIYGATAWDCVMAAEAVHGCWGRHGGRLPDHVTSYWDHVVQHHQCFHAICRIVSQRLTAAKL